MKNKGITLISILIIIAIIAGVGVLGYLGYQAWFGETELAAGHYTSQESCEDAGYYWYDEACHEEINVEQYISKCEAISGMVFKEYEEKTTCYKNLYSKKGGGKDLCKNVKEYDRNMCYVGAAISTSQKEFCEKIDEEGFKKLCFAQVGFSKPSFTKEESLKSCSNINEEEGKTLCYTCMFKQKDYKEEVCSQTTTSNAENLCYIGAASAKENEAICEEVSNDFKEGCYSLIAQLKQAPSLCEKVTDDIGCYEKIADQKEDTDICKDLKGKPRDICYIAVAKSRKEGSLCEKVSDKRVTCYSVVANRTGEPVLCDKLEAPKKRGSCYEGASGITDVKRTCGDIEDSQKEGRCFYGIAVQKEKELLCEGAGTYKGKCYYDLAKIKGDESLCEKAENYSTECYNSFEKEISYLTDKEVRKKLGMTTCEISTVNEEKKAIGEVHKGDINNDGVGDYIVHVNPCGTAGQYLDNIYTTAKDDSLKELKGFDKSPLQQNANAQWSTSSQKLLVVDGYGTENAYGFPTSYRAAVYEWDNSSQKLTKIADKVFFSGLPSNPGYPGREQSSTEDVIKFALSDKVSEDTLPYVSNKFVTLFRYPEDWSITEEKENYVLFTGEDKDKKISIRLIPEGELSERGPFYCETEIENKEQCEQITDFFIVNWKQKEDNNAWAWSDLVGGGRVILTVENGDALPAFKNIILETLNALG